MVRVYEPVLESHSRSSPHFSRVACTVARPACMATPAIDTDPHWLMTVHAPELEATACGCQWITPASVAGANRQFVVSRVTRTGWPRWTVTVRSLSASPTLATGWAGAGEPTAPDEPV